MKVVVSPQASDDLDDRYAAQEAPEAADRLLTRIMEIIAILASGAIEGRQARLRDGRRVQTWPVPPYRVYYRKSADVFEVVRGYHQARRPIEG